MFYFFLFSYATTTHKKHVEAKKLKTLSNDSIYNAVQFIQLVQETFDVRI